MHTQSKRQPSPPSWLPRWQKVTGHRTAESFPGRTLVRPSSLSTCAWATVEVSRQATANVCVIAKRTIHQSHSLTCCGRGELCSTIVCMLSPGKDLQFQQALPNAQV